MKNRIHPLEVFLMVFAALVLTSGAVALHTQSELADKVIRLHVLANSDSEADQALKLRVRDTVLKRATELLAGAESRSDAKKRLNAALPELKSAAERTVAETGYAYGVRVELAETAFPTREYDGFSLPAGNIWHSGYSSAMPPGKTGGAWCFRPYVPQRRQMSRRQHCLPVCRRVRWRSLQRRTKAMY